MYSKATKSLHWLGALLIVLAFALVWTREELPKGALRTAMLEWHQWAGLLVLLILVPRVLAKFRRREGALRSLPLWQRAGAFVTETGLYVMMLVQPMLGWLLASAKGRAVALMGIPLPSLMGVDKGFAKQVADWHEIAGYVILVLVGMHVLAALYHRFWLRDDVLASMLGRWVGPKAFRPRSVTAPRAPQSTGG